MKSILPRVMRFVSILGPCTFVAGDWYRALPPRLNCPPSFYCPKLSHFDTARYNDRAFSIETHSVQSQADRVYLKVSCREKLLRLQHGCLLNLSGTRRKRHRLAFFQGYRDDSNPRGAARNKKTYSCPHKVSRVCVRLALGRSAARLDPDYGNTWPSAILSSFVPEGFQFSSPVTPPHAAPSLIQPRCQATVSFARFFFSTVSRGLNLCLIVDYWDFAGKGLGGSWLASPLDRLRGLVDQREPLIPPSSASHSASVRFHPEIRSPADR